MFGFDIICSEQIDTFGGRDGVSSAQSLGRNVSFRRLNSYVGSIRR